MKKESTCSLARPRACASAQPPLNSAAASCTTRPTMHNAVLRYYHSRAPVVLQQHSPNSGKPTPRSSQYNLAIRMAQNLKKHARPLPGASSPSGEMSLRQTPTEIREIGSVALTTGLLRPSTPAINNLRSHFSIHTVRLSGMNDPDELKRVKSQYAIGRTVGRRKHHRNGYHRRNPRQCSDHSKSDRQPRTRFALERSQISIRKSPFSTRSMQRTC